MTEQPAAPEVAEPPAPESFPEPPAMPPWIPVLIGAVLVAIAGLAVYTGLRREDSAATFNSSRVKARRPARTSAPPGEPQAGASLVFPGESGETVPAASPAVTGTSRIAITGGGANPVGPVARLWARRGMTTAITPAEAVVYVNDLAVGQAKQFDSEDEIYDFPEAGSYTVRITAPGYRDRRFIITASDSAPEDIARIVVRLDKGSQ